MKQRRRLVRLTNVAEAFEGSDTEVRAVGPADRVSDVLFFGRESFC